MESGTNQVKGISPIQSVPNGKESEVCKIHKCPSCGSFCLGMTFCSNVHRRMCGQCDWHSDWEFGEGTWSLGRKKGEINHWRLDSVSKDAGSGVEAF